MTGLVRSRKRRWPGVNERRLLEAAALHFHPMRRIAAMSDIRHRARSRDYTVRGRAIR